jgi:copper resistance protein C
MNRRQFIAAAGSVATFAPASLAHARFRGGAVLDHAVPGVGLTVSGSPRELRLYFDLDVVSGLSKVQVIASTGAVIPVSRPVNDPSDQRIVIVRLGRALSPGIYRVSWLVVSIHERPSSGTFHFTVT